ncbi:hypothetical protein HY995_00610 [Candidatus Micrarchaeota archaeon]|nr:hypothetical protein [Candidatus Micrarchaeota archaeon]MBI5176568.1 hypothetical protein [Candidatus Micrarchaeota archaeon]
MDKIIFVGDSDSALGFRLAGVAEAHSVSTSEEAEQAVQSVLRRNDVGIMVLTQEAMRTLSPKTRRLIRDVAKPVVIEVPGKRDTSSQSESLAAMVKKAIGVELK